MAAARSIRSFCWGVMRASRRLNFLALCESDDVRGISPLKLNKGSVRPMSVHGNLFLLQRREGGLLGGFGAPSRVEPGPDGAFHSANQEIGVPGKNAPGPNCAGGRGMPGWGPVDTENETRYFCGTGRAPGRCYAK